MSKVYLPGQKDGPRWNNDHLIVDPKDGFYVDLSGGISRLKLFELYAKPEHKTPENRRYIMEQDRLSPAADALRRDTSPLARMAAPAGPAFTRSAADGGESAEATFRRLRAAFNAPPESRWSPVKTVKNIVERIRGP